MVPRLVLRRFSLLALFIALPLYARSRAIVHPTDAPPLDVISLAEPSKVRVTHVSLNLDVDFESRVIRGSASETITNFTGTTRLRLDTRDLDISGVTVDGVSAAWSIAPGNSQGDALDISIKADSHVVRIDYATRPDAAALHWLTPLQTAGGIAPLLYTLGEPAMTRSWIPLQDTPGVRAAWDATVHVPSDLIALMSAPNPTSLNAGGVYTFSQTTSVPAYLIALAVGRLEFHDLGGRTGFYSEPELADSATWDLQYLPKMLEAAQRVVGPYPWSRYDLLLLPPGFLAGGMENPVLNFLNSVIIYGNHESPPVPNSVVAHELAHTWTGDLVTCATWSDTWLNEGFATYYEKRIIEEMISRDRADFGFFSDRASFESWARDMSSTPTLTLLHRELARGDTPNVFGPASYLKGGLFLKTIEDAVGREAFDSFMKLYLARNNEHWVDDHAFLALLLNTALSGRSDVEEHLGLSEWLYSKGLPSNVSTPTTSVLWTRVLNEINRFRSGTPASALNTTGWTSFELNLFLGGVNDLIPQRMAELDSAFALSSKKTNSIYWWLAMANTRYAPGMPAFNAFMLSGSSSVATVYRELARTSGGLSFARTMYKTARDRYVPELQRQVDSILGYTGTSALLDAA